MLTVSNTKELEKYGLDRIQDDEKIRVLGGMEGKPKYNEDHYVYRTTYSGRQIKQIISQMKLIESQIPENWNDWQKAKYIYEILAKNISYDYDKSHHQTEQCSNLSVLLSRKAICAGYSLLYKEMMDRQGIKCDYVRGRGGREKHAWNVLTIDGSTFPVDLTWDSGKLRKGKDSLTHFGNDIFFDVNHKPDNDEKEYTPDIIPSKFVDSIDISTRDKSKQQPRQENNQLQKQEANQKLKQSKDDIIKHAIDTTYKKYSIKFGTEYGLKQASRAMFEYCTKRNPMYFTGDSNARKGIIENVEPEDIMMYVIDNYIKQVTPVSQSPVGKAVYETLAKYDEHQVKGALKDYLREGKVAKFTNNNGARVGLLKNGNKDLAFEEMLMGVTRRESEIIEEQKVGFYRPTSIQGFSASEFDEIELSSGKRASGISKAIEWIRQRTNNRVKDSNIDRGKQNEQEFDR